MPEEIVSSLGISRVMAVTSTYDHRIVQGAESGAFLATLQDLLLGAGGFYERIFKDLKVPHRPVAWEPDRNPPFLGGSSRLEAVEKQARILPLINFYRVRGPPPRRPRPARRRHAALPRRARPGDVRLHALGPRPEVHHERPRRARPGDAPRDPRGPAPDLLREGRRRVHEHPGPGAEEVADGPDGVVPQPRDALHGARRSGSSRSSSRRRASRSSSTPSTSATSASPSRGARRRSRS